MAIGRISRPDLKQCVLSSLCVDRASPMWGKFEDGNASDKTLNTPLLPEIAHNLARHGVLSGAYLYIADAAVVSEDNLAALQRILFITHLPATYCTSSRPVVQAPLPGIAGLQPASRSHAGAWRSQENAQALLWRFTMLRADALLWRPWLTTAGRS